MKLADLKHYQNKPAAAVLDAPEETAALNAIGSTLDGRWVEDAGGSYFLVETERDGPHGRHSLLDLARISGQPFSVLTRDADLTFFDFRRAVFLDTETTGLAMGSGTYVFLVGAGFFDGDRFRVHQFFLPGPGNEAAFLSALAEFLGRFAAVVTFNGKAFDWPLLETRFILHRRRLPFDDPPHLDLLHPARRLWKARLESCALSSLERHVLGADRTESDVPGWLIPSLYFRYLRTGDARELEGVFYHNLQDILSLATLAIHMHHLVADPWCGLATHGEDFYSLGKTFDRAGNAEWAGFCYEEALGRGLSLTIRSDCLIRLAALHKRERNWEAAFQAWDRSIELGGASAVYALVEQAKYYEHVERDVVLALDAVQQAVATVTLRASPASQQDLEALEHRLARLVTKRAGNRSWRARRA